MLPTIEEIESSAKLIYSKMPPTAQYCRPLLNQMLEAEVWVKHENHTPIGAFKIRGGLVYLADLTRGSRIQSIVTATRGNHGQSIAMSAKQYGLNATVVVPAGNSSAKNEAMRALGAHLVEEGEDFQAAREHAEMLARETGAHMVPSFHPLLVRGVATYALELFRAVNSLDSVYVPIGLGSGICGVIAVRNALSPQTRIIGVVSAAAPAYSLSFAERIPINAPAMTQLADGMACRSPEPEALEILWRYADRIVEVTDAEIAQAMRLIFDSTQNIAEGAGAAAIAAITKEREMVRGRKIAAVLSGGNVDRSVLCRVFQGG